MKKFLAAFAALFISLPVLSAPVPRAAGNYVDTTRVVITSYTATAIISTDPWDDNADIFNNGAFVLYIGSNTTSLVTTGFPILSSNTYTVDGNFTGTLYGMTDSGASGNQNIRIIRYKRNAQ